MPLTCKIALQDQAGLLYGSLPADSLTLLQPADGFSPRHPGKQFWVDASGSLESKSYRAGKHFRARSCSVTCVENILVLRREIAKTSSGFLVRGAINADGIDKTGRILRRTNQHKDELPGLLRQALHLLTIDLDDVPNPAGWDPRKDPEGTARFLISLLPAALQNTDILVSWSSSMCIALPHAKAPSAISGHLDIFADVALMPGEWSTVLSDMDRYAKDGLATLGTDVSAKQRIIDPKIAEAQQPIFVIPPLLGPGIADPFPGKSRTLVVNGTNPRFILEELRLELAQAEAQRTQNYGPLEQPPARKTRKPKLTPDLMDADFKVGSREEVVAAVEPLRRANQHHAGITAQGKVAKGYKGACHDLAATRKALALVGILVERGGAAESTRDIWLHHIAAQAAIALRHRPDATVVVSQMVAELGALLIGPQWVRNEWLAEGYAAPVLQRLQADRDGVVTLFAGKGTTPIYTYKDASVVEQLQLTGGEIARHGFGRNAWRILARRRAGAPSAEERTAQADQAARAAQAISAEGASVREVARRLDRPVTTIARLLRRQLRGKLVETASGGVPLVVSTIEERDAKGSSILAHLNHLPSGAQSTPLLPPLAQADNNSCDADYSDTDLPRGAVSTGRTRKQNEKRWRRLEEMKLTISGLDGGEAYGAAAAYYRALAVHLGRRNAAPVSAPSPRELFPGLQDIHPDNMDTEMVAAYRTADDASRDASRRARGALQRFYAGEARVDRETWHQAHARLPHSEFRSVFRARKAAVRQHWSSLIKHAEAAKDHPLAQRRRGALISILRAEDRAAYRASSACQELPLAA